LFPIAGVKRLESGGGQTPLLYLLEQMRRKFFGIYLERECKKGRVVERKFQKTEP
jgi:hypothetical protein